jgi:hypothetical protein
MARCIRAEAALRGKPCIGCSRAGLGAPDGATCGRIRDPEGRASLHRLHDLRHTYGSLAIQRGVDIPLGAGRWDMVRLPLLTACMVIRNRGDLRAAAGWEAIRSIYATQTQLLPGYLPKSAPLRGVSNERWPLVTAEEAFVAGGRDVAQEARELFFSAVHQDGLPDRTGMAGVRCVVDPAGQTPRSTQGLVSRAWISQTVC